jgi:predicted transcriptional regulator
MAVEKAVEILSELRFSTFPIARIPFDLVVACDGMGVLRLARRGGSLRMTRKKRARKMRALVKDPKILTRALHP